MASFVTHSADASSDTQGGSTLPLSTEEPSKNPWLVSVYKAGRATRAPIPWFIWLMPAVALFWGSKPGDKYSVQAGLSHGRQGSNYLSSYGCRPWSALAGSWSPKWNYVLNPRHLMCDVIVWAGALTAGPVPATALIFKPSRHWSTCYIFAYLLRFFPVSPGFWKNKVIKSACLYWW